MKLSFEKMETKMKEKVIVLAKENDYSEKGELQQ